MTVIEALNKAEEILGSIAITGRDNVKKVNLIFDLMDASIAALDRGLQENQPKEGGAE